MANYLSVQIGFSGVLYTFIIIFYYFSCVLPTALHQIYIIFLFAVDDVYMEITIQFIGCSFTLARAQYSPYVFSTDYDETITR